MTKHEGCIFDAQPRSQDPGSGDDSMAGGFSDVARNQGAQAANVTGYILAGVAIGPYALDLIPSDIVSGMEFITDIALAFIAFGVGRYLRLDRLKQQGTKVIVLTLMEALVTAAVVTAFMLMVFHLSLAFSLLLGRHRLRYRARFQPDDHPAVPGQGSVRQHPGAGGSHGRRGGPAGFQRVRGHRLRHGNPCGGLAKRNYSVGGECRRAAGGLSVGTAAVRAAQRPLLGPPAGADVRVCILHRGRLRRAGCIAPAGRMLLGATYVNVRGDKTLFKQVSRVTPPINVMFFVLSGMHLDLNSLTTVGIIGAGIFRGAHRGQVSGLLDGRAHHGHAGWS